MFLDHYWPQRLVKSHSNDRPWVTDSFIRLILVVNVHDVIMISHRIVVIEIQSRATFKL
jgi:hypothetical protein